MNFIEERFPTLVSWGMEAGPSFNTEVVKSGAGKPYAYSRWNRPLWKAKGNTANFTKAQGDQVYSFVIAVAQGRLNAFRGKIWPDYQALVAAFGTGDGVTTAFQLAKPYTFNSRTYSRPIYKPNTDVPPTLAGSFPQIFNNGALVSALLYTLDLTTGIVTFASAPATGRLLTWTGCYDVPVFMDEDYYPGTFKSAPKLEFDFAFTEIPNL